MTQEELARAVAADVGVDTTQLEVELSREKTRSFGFVEAATMGSFVVHAAQLGIQLHAAKMTPQELIAELWAKTASAIKIADEKRRAVIERIVSHLTGAI
jgi:hypothetical protein